MIAFERPIVFIDLETTGTNINESRIVELAAAKLHLDGNIETKVYRIYPGIPIPAEATAIHGITDEDVKDKPMFKQLAAGLLSFILGCDLGGYNSNTFDFPLLAAEFSRYGHSWDPSKHNLIDVCNIFKIKEARTLAAAVKFYTSKDIEDAHSAEADILATIDVFQAQCELYFDNEETPMTVEELAIFSNYGKKMLDLSGLFTYDEDGVKIMFAKGKNSGKPATDYDYLKWVVYTSNFPDDTKKIAKQLMNAIPYK